MEGQNIYIVTSGYYSDYDILAAFSTREKADEYVDCHGGSEIRVEEYPIDPPIERKERWWEVGITYESKQLIYCCADDGEMTQFLPTCGTVQGVKKPWKDGVYLRFLLRSDSRDRAIKVAGELFGMVKAEEQTMYPLLFHDAVDHSGSGYTCPRYEIGTGVILLDKYEKISRFYDNPVDLKWRRIR